MLQKGPAHMELIAGHSRAARPNQRYLTRTYRLTGHFRVQRGARRNHPFEIQSFEKASIQETAGG